jgi:hypothetical protein
MRFIIFVIDSQSNSASGDEMAAIDAFNDSLRDGGHWIMAAGIGAPGTATLIDNRSAAGLERSGSLFSDDAFYSGFWIIECDSPELAKQLATEGSLACNRRVEVRPFLA